MAVTKKGVATLMKVAENSALEMHCHRYATNLAYQDSIKQVKCVRDVHGTVDEITKQIRKLLKRNSHIEKIKSKMSNDEEEKIAPRSLSSCAPGD